jgi:hypothetical protein
MAFYTGNAVVVTSTTTGLGSYTLGSAVANHIVPLGEIPNGNVGYWRIYDGTDYELIRGTYTEPSTLARNHCYESSNGDAFVDWAPGTRTVSSIIPGWALNSIISQEAQATFGFLARTLADTYVAREMTSGDTSTLTIADGDGVSDNPTFTVDAVPSGGGTFTGDLTTEGVLISDLLDLAHTTTRITGYASNEHLIERTASNRFAKLVNNGGTNDDWDLKLFQNGSATPVSVITENQIPLSGMTTGAVLYADSATTLDTALGPPLLISEDTISAQTNLDITLPSGWQSFVLVIDRLLVPGGDDIGLRVDVGSGYLTTQYEYVIDARSNGASGVEEGNTTYIPLNISTQGLNGTTNPAYYRIEIINPGDSTFGFYALVNGSYFMHTQAEQAIVNGMGRQHGDKTRAVGVRLFDVDSNNMTAGKVRLYGIA